MIAKFDNWRSPAATLILCLTIVGTVGVVARSILDASIAPSKSQPRNACALSSRPLATGSHSERLLRIRDYRSTSLSLDEASNGSTIQASPGQTIELTLHNTYWRIQPSSNPSIVAL